VTWWGWTLLWLVLVVGAAVYLFLLGRMLWRKVSALFTELGAASELMGSVSEQLEALNRVSAAVKPDDGEPAVFADLQALRRKRDRDVKRRVRRARASARRGEPARRPGRG
jgi:hypothetical protein